MNTNNSLTIELKKSVVTFQVPLVQEMDENVVVKSMNVDILFHLRYKHPVIDGAGYLQESNSETITLLMI